MAASFDELKLIEDISMEIDIGSSRIKKSYMIEMMCLRDIVYVQMVKKVPSAALISSLAYCISVINNATLHSLIMSAEKKFALILHAILANEELSWYGLSMVESILLHHIREVDEGRSSYTWQRIFFERNNIETKLNRLFWNISGRYSRRIRLKKILIHRNFRNYIHFPKTYCT